MHVGRVGFLRFLSGCGHAVLVIPYALLATWNQNRKVRLLFEVSKRVEKGIWSLKYRKCLSPRKNMVVYSSYSICRHHLDFLLNVFWLQVELFNAWQASTSIVAARGIETRGEDGKDRDRGSVWTAGKND